MGTVLVFICGMLFMAGISYIMIPRAKSNNKVLTVVNWILYVLICADLAMGASFCYINSSFGHEKATSTAIFLFFGTAIVMIVIWARTMGFIGGKKQKGETAHE